MFHMEHFLLPAVGHPSKTKNKNKNHPHLNSKTLSLRHGLTPQPQLGCDGISTR